MITSSPLMDCRCLTCGTVWQRPDAQTIRQCGACAASVPTYATITRDQVKRYGTKEALDAWDARFPHDRVYEEQP